MELAVKLGRLSLSNPFVAASGVFGTEWSAVTKVLESDASAMVSPTQFKKPRPWPQPPVFRSWVHWSMVDTGLWSPGIDEFCAQLSKVRKSGKPVFVNLGEIDVEAALICAENLRNAGADGLELNPFHGRAIPAPRRLSELVSALKSKAPELPVFVKLPLMAEVERLAQTVCNAGADGLTLIGPPRGLAYDLEEWCSAERIEGYVCGHAIHPLATYWIERIRTKFPDVPIMGCGGVYNWSDALEFLVAGANAVQVGTALSEQGLALFSNLVSKCENYLAKQGFASISECVQAVRSTLKANL
ncbi:MAG: tRNA-dihydrouridine synthase [Thermoprotei archaeon]